MSIQQNFPAISPSLSLNFARSKTLDPRITFTRTSTATRVNGQGLIEVVPANAPRFDHSHDPVSGTVKSLGLLIEEQRTNYTINSEDLSLWTATANMIPTGNAILLPNGTISTGVEYRGETTEANTKLLRPSPSGSGVTAGDTWVFSVFLRAGTEDTCYITLLDRFNSGGTGRAFDMVNGVFLGTQGYSGTVTGGQTGVEKYSNGWYRAWISGIFTVDEPQGHQIYLRLNANSNFIPLTTSFSAWGSQLEKGSFPTSYIPTSGSTATRTIDLAFLNDSKIFFPRDESSFYVETSRPQVINGNASVIEGADVTGLTIAANGDGDRIRTIVRHGSSRIDTASRFPLVSPNQVSKISVGISSTATISYHNGVSDSGGNPGQSNWQGNLRIGHRISGTSAIQSPLNGHIHRISYYPKRLSNTQLQTLTK
jgi:hypothetical protein